MTIALFCGRFQPPHIGHLLTINRYYGEYEKIIIAVLNQLSVFPVNDIVQTFRKIYRFMPDIEVIKFNCSFFTREYFGDLPDYDIIISANEELVKRLKDINVKVRYVPRSQYLNRAISGTAIRRSLLLDT